MFAFVTNLRLACSDLMLLLPLHLNCNLFPSESVIEENPINFDQVRAFSVGEEEFASISKLLFLSDSGFGGASAYGSSASKRDSDGNESPRKPDLDGLTPFEKNFYVESPAVAAMTEAEVEEYRKLREITVEGRDIPKPVKSFRDVGFPGKLISS